MPCQHTYCGRVWILIQFVVYISAPYIKPCAVNDPNFQGCVLEHAREALPHVVKGNRKLQIPSLDPLHILELKQENVPQNALSFTLKDIKLMGFKDTEIQKIE